MLPLDQNQTVDQATVTVATAGAACVVGLCWFWTWRNETWYVGPFVALLFVATFSAWMSRSLTLLALFALVCSETVVSTEKSRSKRDIHGFTRWLFVACAFATLIAGLSNSSGSPGHLHEQLAAWLHITPDQAWYLVVGVRKTIHFSAYGLATLAAYRWSTANGAPGLWRGIAFTLPLACFDEFRQHFAAGREGSPWDVALDMAGAVTFLFIAWLIDRRRSASAAA